MNKEIFNILCCPLCKNGLSSSNGFFICGKCNKKYEIIRLENGLEIPNFLIKDSNWDAGPRYIKSKVLKFFNGSSFKININSSKLVLDVGCGEVARGNINLDCYLPENIPPNFILANAEYLPFKSNSVDIVLSNYNIEHLVNPGIFLQSIYSITKEKMEIITDNSEWFGDFVFRIIGDGRIFHDEHYYKWSVEYFRNLLNRLGLKSNNVYLLNLSSNPFIKFISIFGKIPRFGNFFYRDLKAIIYKKQ